MITFNKEDAFTIVDIISKAQEVIRCKDCKYAELESYIDEDTGKEVKYYSCEKWYADDCGDGNLFPNADDFCSRGERAE